jgi:hypothetical protein
MEQPMKHHKSFIAAKGNFLSFCGTFQTVLLAVLALAGVAQPAGAQVTYVLSNALTIATGTGNLTGGSAAVRGMAYNVVSNQVLAANTGGTIDAFDGTAGTLVGALSTSGVSGGTFTIDQIGAAADGAIYAVNLSTASSSPNKFYRWANWQATPTVAFNGNALANGGSISLTSGRIGDTLAATGSGTGTLLLAGVGGQKAFVLFYTTDGVNFNPVIINVPSGYTAGGNVFGICFFTNNTFLVKSSSSGNSTVYFIQYPANFASSTLVTGTVLGTTSLGSTFNATTLLSYSPASGLLAAVETGNSPSGVSPIGLFSLTNITTSATLLTSSNATTTYAGGNATGGTVLNGTNSIYELTTGNPLYNYAILSVPPVPPTISTAPAGGTSYSSETLSVTAAGTQPFSYRWLASTNDSATATTFTNIPGATNSTFTVTAASTNYYEVIITNVAGSVTSTPVQVAVIAPVTSPVVSNLWHVAVGTAGYTYLTTDNNCRGLGYDTNLQRLVVASTTGGSGLYILDANAGTNIGTLSLTGVSFGGLLGGVDQVGIGDDGIVYAGNLVSGSGFTLYSWPATTNSAPGYLAFQDSGSLGGSDRWGDTMAVRGAGTGTQIILGSRSGTNVALLTTYDGVNFTGTYIAISNAVPGFAANGIAFGAGNTLWAKADLGHLYEISFDPVGLVGGVLLDYPNPAEIPTFQVGVGIDSTNGIMAGIDLGDSPSDLKLYQLTGTSDAPVLFNQAFFPSANGNGNANVAIAMKYPRVYGLDVNNGIVALSYGVPPTTPPAVTTPPASQAAYTNNPQVVMQVSVTGSLPLHYQWQFSTASNGPFANVSLATNSTYTLNYPGLNKAGYYQVVVHNIAGSATSTPPALLTILLPTTSTVVTPLWTIPGGGSLSFLDSSTYDTRGLAFDTNTMQVVIADNANLHLLNATNGSYLGDLNVSGAFNGGYNGWLFDQVGVADDGTLYAANLTLNGPDFVILSWAPGFAAGTVGTAFVYGGSGTSATGADPGNGSGDRWGDTMSVRGSGTNTEILIGSYSGTNVVLFTTTDGQNFSANLIPVTNAPAGFSGQGIAFGAGDTFWTKSPTYNLRQVSFDRTSWTGSVTQLFTAGTQFPSAFDGIAVDVGANVLAGVNFGDSPNDAQLYLLSDNTNPPALFDQVFFGSVNINSQKNAATALKAGLGFSLDVNNGVVAFSYGLPAAPGVTITSVVYAPGHVTINWNNVFSGHTYQLQSAATLVHPTWVNVGAPVSTSNPTASAVDTSSSATAKFYRVISN